MNTQQSDNRERRLNLDWCVKFRRPDKKNFRIGVTLDHLGPPECTYMTRYILWLEPLGTVRLHKFWRSDDDRNLHNHPWWFITFPFGTYDEWVPNPYHFSGETPYQLNEVKGWRFHFRPATYQHAVVLRKPCWTFIITGTRFREWGFIVKGVFHQWKQYFRSFGSAPCSDPSQDVQEQTKELTA